MRGFRHHHPSENGAGTRRFSNPSSNARGRQKRILDAEEERRKRRNCEKREKRAKEKVGELKEVVGDLEAKVEELEMVVEATSDEKEMLHEEFGELQGSYTELNEEMKRLTARFNARVRREPQKIETAVREAVGAIFVSQQTTYEIKTPAGTIQDWVRSVILHLVCTSDVPAAKTWTAFHSVAEGLGVHVEGSWSARSAGRIVLEGALAAEEMIVEDFANALGASLVPSKPTRSLNNAVLSLYAQR
jgi:uncharacterized protein YoxC